MISANLNGVNKPIVDSIHTTTLELTEELHELQLAIHANPQIAFQEVFAHDISTNYMEKKGWKVTRHAYGLETAWEASFEVGTGGPVIGYNSESKPTHDTSRIRLPILMHQWTLCPI